MDLKQHKEYLEHQINRLAYVAAGKQTMVAFNQVLKQMDRLREELSKINQSIKATKK